MWRVACVCSLQLLVVLKVDSCLTSEWSGTRSRAVASSWPVSVCARYVSGVRGGGRPHSYSCKREKLDNPW